jgi:5-(carboxyamino)imidazole ribonucleotide synthase
VIRRVSSPLVPPATVGVLGGGQLARYAIVAARTMGYRTIVVDPDPSAPAGRVADDHLVTAYDDPATLRRLELDADVVTTEFENPPATVLDHLAERVRVAPSPASVRVAQDRIAEKKFLGTNGFPVGAYAVLDDGDTSIDSFTSIDPRLFDNGAVVKTARLGYDGKGQRRVSNPAELYAAWGELGGVPSVVEAFLSLETELSVVVARTVDGRVEPWEVAENRHVDGILDLTVVPAQVSSVLADRAVGLAVAVADALDYVGVLAVELFVVDDDLLVNEIAPRPHNSGHWTLDGSATSQFEQQIRAVCGLGLGRTNMTVASIAMVNLLGELWSNGDPDWTPVLDDPRAKLHLYGKSVARRGRKMGHLTVVSDVASEAAERAIALRAAIVANQPIRS